MNRYGGKIKNYTTIKNIYSYFKMSSISHKEPVISVAIAGVILND